MLNPTWLRIETSFRHHENHCSIHHASLPVSVATADGNAIVVVPGTRKLRPAEESILFSTSSDNCNQTSASLSIDLGDHLKPDENLDNLIPMPKNAAHIRATFVIDHSTRAEVTVEQVVDGENVCIPFLSPSQCPSSGMYVVTNQLVMPSQIRSAWNGPTKYRDKTFALTSYFDTNNAPHFGQSNR